MLLRAWSTLRDGAANSVLLMSLTACVTLETKITQPFLWKIETNGQPCYLLGTIHSGAVTVSMFPSTVTEAMDHSQVVLMEAPEPRDPARATPSVFTERMNDAKLRDGDAVQLHLSPKAWEQLQTRVGSSDAAWIDQFEPWVAWLYYETIPGVLTEDDLTPDGNLNVLDTEIEELANARGATLIGLDGDLKAEMLLALNTSLDFKQLNEILEQDASGVARVTTGDAKAELEDAYLASDLQAFEPILETEKQRQRYQLLVGARNVAWMKKIDAALSVGGCFIAVGVGHVVGPQSLVTLIERRKFKISRFKN